MESKNDMNTDPSENIWGKAKTHWIKIWRNEYALAAITTILIIGLVAIYLENSCLILKYIYTSFVAIWAICLIINGYKKAKSNNSFLAILDCAILLLLGALIALVVGVISKTIDIQSEETSAFTIMSFTLALAGLIPYLISRTIAKSEIDKIVDEKVEMLFNKKITELENINNTSLHNLTKQSAHSARITAKTLANSSNKNDSKWAIGWASQALIRYMQINYKPESVFYKDCITIISDGIKETKTPESETTDDAQTRASVDLLDMFLLYMSSAKNHFMGDKFETIKGAINKYSTDLSLDKLFEKSKFYEYTHTELPEDKQKAHFKRLLQNHGINYQQKNDIDNTQ